VTSVLLWAIIGFAAWYLAAHPYERLLGSIAWDFFPQKEVFLALKDHVFSIGLTGGGDTPVKGGGKVYRWGGAKLYHRTPQDDHLGPWVVRAGFSQLPEAGWFACCA
jgi:hypothetical protein